MKTLAELKARNKERGMYWFSRDTMRFFKSKIHGGISYGNDRDVYFISSEKTGFDDNSPREFKVRRADWETADIKTFADGFKTLADAREVMRAQVKADGKKWTEEQNEKRNNAERD